MNENDYIIYFGEKYPYLNNIDLEMTYKLAKERIINALYPFRDDVTEIPRKYEMKVLEVMEEIISTSDMRHYTSYSENGVSWSKLSTDLESLQDITPMAG